MVYTSTEELKQHARAHQGQTPFKCSECEFKSIEFKTFTNHIQGKKHMMKHIGGKDGITTRLSFAESVKSNSQSPNSKKILTNGKLPTSTKKKVNK